ncbi:hypothetical protein SAMN05216241_105187 [Limimonas halophila]|uniref:Galactosyl transferase GMA12/MNN10 family protein n=1 Tax=Limimonas halophila TaxID=1082479 RepID=A0A1G7RP37_9PROT|nr:hypothetical protein [Limimonas halophila]SDG11760.1 hypothetical protein SAMN05216241_105187 [Limimonas halophila]
MAAPRERGGTLIVQSVYADPPAWIGRCMESVRAWAEAAGFTYRGLGDELFDRVPDWVRRKTAERPSTCSDLARAAVLQDALDEGWGRVVWLDADVLVVQPGALTAALRLDEGYLLGREAWLQADRGGRLQTHTGVHNAVFAVAPDNAFLAFYRHAAERILARHEGTMVPQLIGPKFLTALDNMMGLPATWAVNMASPRVVADLAAGGGPARDRLLARSGRVPAALNLCHSHAGAATDGVSVTAAMLDDAITTCLRDGLR